MSESGQLDYTNRAFAQDASLAMEGKIERALIELITNADDAYGAKEGTISVHVMVSEDPYSFTVSVSDAATGLTHAELKDAFTQIGGKKSKLAGGGESRGLLGRGAKDVAIFGSVRFEALKGGGYSDLIISKDGRWTSEFADTPPTKEQLQSIGLAADESGLKATVSIRKGINFPSAKALHKEIRNTAQLRKLYDRRSVTFTDDRDDSVGGILTSNLPRGEVILEAPLVIEGFPGDSSIVLRRLQERQVGRESDSTAHGLLVISGKSTFENTWFSMSNRPESLLLSGEIVVPQAMEILRDELKRDDVDIALVTRTRAGLTRRHPFVIALQRAVTLVVQPIMDAIAQENPNKEGQGEKLNRALRVVAESIRQDVRDLLRDLEDDSDSLGGDDSGLSNFDVIPPRLVVAPGQSGTLTVRVVEALTHSPMTVSSSENSCVTPHDENFGTPISPAWNPHSRLERLVAKWSFTAGAETGKTTLKFAIDGSSVEVEVDVRETIHPLPEIPTKLEFRPSQSSVSPQRSRNLLVVAPIDFVDSQLAIASTGVALQGIAPEVTLSATPDGRFAQARVRITASSEVGKADITAVVDSHSAMGQVTVQEAGTRNGLDFDFRLENELNPAARWWMTPTPGVGFALVVYPKHPSFNGVFGDYDATQKKFKHEDEGSARAVLATTVAIALASYFTEKEYEKHPDRQQDPIATLSRWGLTFEKLVGKIEKALRPQA